MALQFKLLVSCFSLVVLFQTEIDGVHQVKKVRSSHRTVPRGGAHTDYETYMKFQGNFNAGFIIYIWAY